MGEENPASCCPASSPRGAGRCCWGFVGLGTMERSEIFPSSIWELPQSRCWQITELFWLEKAPKITKSNRSWGQQHNFLG